MNSRKSRTGRRLRYKAPNNDRRDLILVIAFLALLVVFFVIVKS